MAKCRDCKFWTYKKTFSVGECSSQGIIMDVDADWDWNCPDYESGYKGPKPLADVLAEALEAVLHAHTGAWFSHTNLPGKTEDAEAEAQKLEERGYTALARYQKEKADGQQ